MPYTQASPDERWKRAYRGCAAPHYTTDQLHLRLSIQMNLLGSHVLGNVRQKDIVVQTAIAAAYADELRRRSLAPELF